MNTEIAHVEKPDTLRSNTFKEWVRVNFLSSHIHALPKDKEVLDLACGWGFAFKINPNIVGIEYDQACVDFLCDKGFRVVRGNILQNLPFEPESFDIVFSHDVLEHFEAEESQKIFEVVFPVLKPGGKFINVVPNKLGYEYGVDIEVGHKHYVVPEDVQKWSTNAGFKYDGFYHSPFPGFFDSVYKHNKRVITCTKPKV